MADENYLLGNGQSLTNVVPRTFGPVDKRLPYSIETAKQRLRGDLEQANGFFSRIRPEECSQGRVCGLLTMHPRFISKSDYPSSFLRNAGLTVVGSRKEEIEPDDWGLERDHDRPPISTTYFVVGMRANFAALPDLIHEWLVDSEPNESLIAELCQVEEFSALTPSDRIQPGFSEKTRELECVVHTVPGDDVVTADFIDFARNVGVSVDSEKVRHHKNLSFVPAKGDSELAEDVASFSLLRAIRPMPEIRPIDEPSVTRSAEDVGLEVPKRDSDELIQVAAFDGGLPPDHNFGEWATGEPDTTTNNLASHGNATCSAMLFGPIEESPNRLEEPSVEATVFNVLEDESGNSLGVYEILERIEALLQEHGHRFEFLNFSVGPNKPVEDNDVDAWTAMIDELAAGGDKFVTVAVGNTGKRSTQNNSSGSFFRERIQPPADAVNAVSVGAFQRDDDGWCRASYSSVGPGRSPGLVKPDGVAFGGSEREPFRYLQSGRRKSLGGTYGTSFAAPSVLGTAASVRSELGAQMSTTTLRALMLHGAEAEESSDIEQVGWGRFQEEHGQLITCADHQAMVVYEGTLAPRGNYLRANVPVPEDGFEGYVSLTATYCISPYTEPAHPMSYTQAGLEVVFRPRVDHEPSKTVPFFSQNEMKYSPEWELRQSAHKWEATAKSRRRFMSDTLKSPCFDIYGHTRSSASIADDDLLSQDIEYSLVITLEAKKVDDLYAQIQSQFGSLNAMTPIEVPVKTQVT